MATAVTLSNKQKQHLKSLAHSLKPVVLLGANGLTEGVMAEIELALAHHELIKVKVPDEDREMREQIYTTILAHSQATKVQVVGKILTLYKPSDAQKIQLPRS